MKLLKQEERLEVKKVQLENKLLIEKNRKMILFQKKQNVENVKKDLLISSKKIEYYWNRKLNFINEENKKKIEIYEKITKEKENELKMLELTEDEMIKKLEKTQNFRNNINDKLQEIYITDPENLFKKIK